MHDLIREKLADRQLLILGFGREGQSTYRLIRKVLPEQLLTIADANEAIPDLALLAGDQHLEFSLGKDYLSGLDRFDLIIKTPGITRKDLPESLPRTKITSQTDLFLQNYSQQVAGITGTKGKSTTSSLLYHILKHAEKPAVLLGNIGRPAFDLVDEISPETTIVFEMSSHQLEYIRVAPHIAVLLNLYQEHLDAYHSFRDYQLAKWNITACQDENDYFIYNADDDLILGHLLDSAFIRHTRPFSAEHAVPDGCFVRDEKIIFSLNEVQEEFLDLAKKRKLKGGHNVLNIMAVIICCKILGIDDDLVREGIASFTGLEHRLEDAGEYQWIRFFNDSIATIPEACIEAVKALGNVDTLILGGFDRKVDYSGLAAFLSASVVRNFILVGEAGQRIGEELMKLNLQDKKLFPVSRFDDFAEIAFKETRKGSICLLSPAAASYDEFQNFEMRGKRFKELVSGKASNS